MNQLEYVPGIAGQSVQLDGPSAFVGIAEEMRSREWDYDLGYRDLVTATRPARTVDVTFNADYQTADTLRRVADADVMARTPGTFVAQKEWKQRGYILASQPNDIHYGRLSTGLKIALLDGAWWRLVKRSFVPEITTPEYRSATGETVTASGASGAPLHTLAVDGESVQDGTPTPSSPVPVEVVRSKNLLNPKLYSGGGYNPTVGTQWTLTDSPVQFTANSDKTVYSIDTTATWRTYTLLLDVTGYDSGELWLKMTFASTGTAGISRGYLDSSYNVLTVFNNTNTSYAIDESLTNKPSNAAYYYIVITNRGTASTTLSLTTPLVCEGNAAIEYIPYGSIGLKVNDTITPIDLQGNVLASLPDGTKDVLTVDSAGHVVLDKRVNKYTIIGNESIWNTTNLESVYRFNIAPSGLNAFAGDVAALSDCLPGATGYGTNTEHVYTNASRIWLYISNTYNTAADALAAVANSNVYYKLATPQTIDLGYIDMPAVPLDAQISITAAVTPTITAEWQVSRDAYLDYPHNYPHDYQATSSTADVTPSVLTPSDVYLVVFGPAVNPYVIVGGNRYQVNVTVPAGGYLVVDGRDKTINLTLADGTVQNVFSSGVRGGGAGGGSYIFERIPAGTSEVTYDGSFGFDLGWYEEEGEPPWSQS